MTIARTATAPKRIENWKVIPTSGGTVSLVGEVKGTVTQTSPICQARPGEMRTENSHYVLGTRQPGLWEVQLQMHRPIRYANLCAAGAL